MSELFVFAINILSYLFEGYCAVLLFGIFVKPKSRFVYSSYAVGIIWSVMGIVLTFAHNSAIVPLLKLTVFAAVLTAFSLLWHKGNAFNKVIPAVQFIAVRELSVQASNCMLELCDPIVDGFIRLAGKGTISYYDLPFAVKTTFYIFTILIELVKSAVIYLSVKNIIKSCRFDIRPGKEAFMYFLPSAVGVMLAAMIRLIIITFENGIPVLAFRRYPALYVIIPVISLILLCLIVFSFKMNQEMTALQKSQTEKSVLESQLTHIQHSLMETERLYDSIRAVRHDMKNNIAVLRNLISEKCPDDEDVAKYFHDMSLSVGKLESRVKTGNAVCDTVISGKFGLAEKLMPDIELNADEFIISNDMVKSFDMGIILNNALDNAVEACVRLKGKYPKANAYIKIRSFYTRNLLFIEAENSFDGLLKRDKKTGMFLSTKDNSELHGIGLRNIKNCAEKYSGGVDFIIEDGVFTLSVMLKGVTEFSDNTNQNERSDLSRGAVRLLND